jgi:hypothetical protein
VPSTVRTLFASVALAAVVALAAGVEAEARVQPQVAGLQVALRTHDLYRGSVDAELGPLTRRGVRAFQRRAGLPVDGVAGARTRKALGRLGRPLFGRRVLHAGQVGWDVSVLQFLLVRHGFRLGTLDGGLGPRTDAQARRFQRWAGLPADGWYGPATRAELRVAPNAASVRRRVVGTLVRWARRYRIDPKLARALAWVESGLQPGVVSPAGAWGVMQVTPGTWGYVEAEFLGDVPATPRGNVRVGLRYLRYLLDDFGGRVRRALAAYNQGPGSLREDGVYAETRQYVRAVLALRARL